MRLKIHIYQCLFLIVLITYSLEFETLIPEDKTKPIKAWRCTETKEIGENECYCRDYVLCSHCRCDYFVRKKLEAKTSQHN